MPDGLEQDAGREPITARPCSLIDGAAEDLLQHVHDRRDPFVRDRFDRDRQDIERSIRPPTGQDGKSGEAVCHHAGLETCAANCPIAHEVTDAGILQQVLPHARGRHPSPPREGRTRRVADADIRIVTCLAQHVQESRGFAMGGEARCGRAFDSSPRLQQKRQREPPVAPRLLTADTQQSGAEASFGEENRGKGRSHALDDRNAREVRGRRTRRFQRRTEQEPATGPGSQRRAAASAPAEGRTGAVRAAADDDGAVLDQEKDAAAGVQQDANPAGRHHHRLPGRAHLQRPASRARDDTTRAQ